MANGEWAQVNLAQENWSGELERVKDYITGRFG